MEERAYAIRLSVPLGARSGTMLLREQDGHIDGWLDVMRHRNELTGQLAPDGSMTLSGSIRTLISRIAYTARGTRSGTHILLNLTTENGGEYSLTGEECDKGGR